MKSLKKYLLLMMGILISLSISACSNTQNDFDQNNFGGVTGRLYFDENSNEECDCECGIEDIKIRLYRNTCTGTFTQTIKTDEEGYYSFIDLTPGTYCIFPDMEFSCTGYFPTSGINRVVEVVGGEEVIADWFTYEIYVDLDE